MVILYLYDFVNGYRYRHVSYAYYERIVYTGPVVSIVSAFLVPGTQENH